jgi:hypothetical protein
MDNDKRKNSNRFGLRDFLIIVIFLSVAAACVCMFWFDLMYTINLQNVEPVGTVIVKKNTVQRRLSDRVLWDRLAYESPVYLGDLIRVAEVSAATLNVKNSSLDLNENTLIRVTLSPDGELLIELSEGSLSVAVSNESGVVINLGGKQVRTAPGTVLSASSGSDGIAVRVNEGHASLIDSRGARDISAGNILALDENGAQRIDKAAVVISPAANARYLKSSSGPLPVLFTWNRINMGQDDVPRLEISSNRYFNNISSSASGTEQARLSFNEGFWYWRLSLDGEILASGQITVADGRGPALFSPAANSLFRYQGELPVINFQWEETDEAVAYLIEVSRTPDFLNPQIRRQSSSAFTAESSLDTGTWFWRVMPVFPQVFSGSAAYSPVGFFRVERGSMPAENADITQYLAAVSPSTEIPPDVPAALVPEQLRPPPPPPPAPAPSARPAPAPRPAAAARPAPTPAPAPSPAPAAPLGTPENLRPSRGTVIGVEQLAASRNIVFMWSPVQGANAYIFTLYLQTDEGRSQLVRTPPIRDTNYTLSDLGMLDNGTFVWHVEPVSLNRSNIIERRGNIAEGVFVINFPAPTPVKIEETGILYGN